MSHGVHNHGHHHVHGHHGHHGAGKAHGHDKLAQSTPAAQAQQPQQPNMDSAMAALDAAIQSLAANFHKDSFNGQAAPADVQQAPSTLTNSVGSRNQDLFLNAGAAAPQATPTTSTSALNDPVLDIKGGGGASGGMLRGDATYLGQAGGGGASGGMLRGDTSFLNQAGGGGASGGML
jgi:hypothetical protein